MKTITYTVQIITQTGLHIGAGKDKVEIGGMDQPVVKDRDGFPYLPASSLKGKLRSLYEVTYFPKDLKDKKDWFKIFDWKNYDEVSLFFGKAWEEKNNLEHLWPTRFIFRDLKLAEKEQENWYYGKQELEKLRKSWEPIFEEKMEVSIDRFTGTASHSWPRPLERVPARTVFEWKLIVRLFEKEEVLKQWGKNSEEEILNDKFWENLSKLKALIENDYLWGQWSRWSGEISITFTLVPENNS